MYTSPSRARVSAGILAVILLALPFFPLHAQIQSRPRVGVVSLQRDPDPRIGAAADSVINTIELTLNQLDRYDVQRVPAFDPARAEEYLGDLDFVVYGSVRDEAGVIEVVLSVWSRAEMRPTDSVSTRIESIFNLFDRSDEAAIALLEAFSGEIIRFGTIRFVNSGSPGEFMVRIDGVTLPEGTQETQTLVGTRTVTIIQERMLGEHRVAEQSITVEEGRVRRFEFSVPLLTPQERRTLLDIEGRILEDWDNPDRVAVMEQQFSRLSLMLSDISYSPDLRQFRDRFSDLHEEYRARVAAGFEDVEIEDELTPVVPEREDEPEIAETPPETPVALREPEPDPTTTVRGLALGMKLGAHIGWFTGDDWDEMVDILDAEGSANDSEITTFSIRTFLEWDIVPSLALQLEMGYVRRAAEIWFEITGPFGFFDVEEEYSVSTLDFSLYLKPQARIGRGEVYLLGGPLLSFVLGDLEYEVEVSGATDSDSFSESIDVDNSVLFGLAFGAGVAFPLGPGALVLDFIYSRTFTELLDDVDIYAAGVSILGGYRYRM